MSKKKNKNTSKKKEEKKEKKGKVFKVKFKNDIQSAAWSAFHSNDIVFLIGPAGTGKTYLACAFAIEQILHGEKEKVILTRPIVESGESLGYLPGEFEDKVQPYMMPMYDCIDKLVGKDGKNREKVNKALEISPIAYMRGRSQPLDSLVLTPQGYVEMGSIKSGDYVIGGDGLPARVNATFYQGYQPVYKLKFSDGTSCEASDDHLWYIRDSRNDDNNFELINTAKLEALMEKTNALYEIPITGFVDFSIDPIQIHPYILGYLLGVDAFFVDGNRIIVKNISDEINYIIKSRFYGQIDIVDKDLYIELQLSDSFANQLIGFIKDNKIINRHDGFYVPEFIKYLPSCQRFYLLKGMMDGCGYCEQQGSVSVVWASVNCKEKILLLKHLVETFGGLSYDIHLNDARFMCDIRLPFNPFFDEKKRSLFIKSYFTRKIVDIEYIGTKLCQCINVNTHDGLYLTNNCIVTHNTFDNAVCIFDEAQNATKVQLKLFLTRFGENSKIIITGDPSQTDIKGNKSLSEIIHKISGIDGIAKINFSSGHVVRHPLVEKIINKLG